MRSNLEESLCKTCFNLVAQNPQKISDTSACTVVGRMRSCWCSAFCSFAVKTHMDLPDPCIGCAYSMIS